ncbi:MAG: carboxypeptidase regulatory-like domain-containing protein, partial [Candidatus Eremiobacteraeota bacterium]|nr:carboxypeptidase regulatory-like domain-containing protein [Candidatus Eremiobacteraeota bacterium]
MRILLHAGLSAFFGLLLIAGPSSTAAIASEHSTQRIAQAATTGRLTGTVQDPSNAAVSGASVSVTGNGQNLHAATNNIGYFEFNVPPGLYDVVITKGGFQTNETDSVGVIAGSTTNLSIFLTAATLSTLREIGRVTSRATNSINNRPVAVTTVGQDDIYSRALPNLEEIAQELPGVTITRSTGTDPNAEFRIRGMDVETRTMIDGHPLSSGVFGDYNTAYDNAALFQQVEVVKGVGGLSGPNAGESPVGTINLRT